MRPPAPSRLPAVALRDVREADALPAAADLDVLRAPGPLPPGGWVETAPISQVSPEALAAWLQGRLGGAGWPAWADGGQGAWRRDTWVARAPDVWWWPRFGVLADATGAVFEAPSAEARAATPDLSRLPGVRRHADGAVRFTPPRHSPRRPAGAVFTPFGGVNNYGHFLLDALPALLALEEAGLARVLPPVAPRLRPWARDLLALAFGDTLRVEEVPAPVVRLGEAAFANPMDHFLHRANELLPRLRARMLARAPPPPAGPGRRLYLSRRRQPQRLMLEERALEAALAARGFEILSPEALSAGAQVAAMRGCAVLVAPAGAALANALFLPDGARVVEILPSNFASHWVRDLCHLCGLEWSGWCAPAPLDTGAEPWGARLALAPRRALRRYAYAWRLDLPAFLAFLDARL